VTEQALGSVDDAWRLTMPDIPLPYSPTLESDVLPDAASIVDEVATRAGIGV
jgi:pyruvate/2-oxoglutarate/acetoin dehydrogenase E1 component